MCVMGCIQPSRWPVRRAIGAHSRISDVTYEMHSRVKRQPHRTGQTINLPAGRADRTSRSGAGDPSSDHGQLEGLQMSKLTIKTGAEDHFFQRGRRLARAADRCEALPSESAISFEAPAGVVRLIAASWFALGCGYETFELASVRLRFGRREHLQGRRRGPRRERPILARKISRDLLRLLTTPLFPRGKARARRVPARTPAGGGSRADALLRRHGDRAGLTSVNTTFCVPSHGHHGSTLR